MVCCCYRRSRNILHQENTEDREGVGYIQLFSYIFHNKRLYCCCFWIIAKYTLIRNICNNIYFVAIAKKISIFYLSFHSDAYRDLYRWTETRLCIETNTGMYWRALCTLIARWIYGKCNKQDRSCFGDVFEAKHVCWWSCNSAYTMTYLWDENCTTSYKTFNENVFRLWKKWAHSYHMMIDKTKIIFAEKRTAINTQKLWRQYPKCTSYLSRLEMSKKVLV